MNKILIKLLKPQIVFILALVFDFLAYFFITEGDIMLTVLLVLTTTILFLIKEDIKRFIDRIADEEQMGEIK